MDQDKDKIETMDDLEITPEEIEKLATGQVGVGNFDDTKTPHAAIKSADFLVALKPFSKVIEDSSEVYSRSMLIQPKGNRIYLYANNGGTFLSTYVIAENTTNMLKTSYIVQFKFLLSIIRNSPGHVVLQDRDGYLVTAVLGGEVELENFNLDPGMFLVEPDGESIEIDTLPAVDFSSRCAAICALSTKIEDRRMLVENGVAYFNFLSCLCKIDSGKTFPDMSIRGSDMAVLSQVFQSASQVKFINGKEHLHFETDFYKVSFVKLDCSDLSAVSDMLNKIEFVGGLVISPIQVRSIATMIKQMIGVTGLINVKAEDNKVRIVARTSTGKIVNIPIGVMENVEFSTAAPTNVFSMAIGLFSSIPTIDFKYTKFEETGIGSFALTDGTTTVVFGSMS